MSDTHNLSRERAAAWFAAEGYEHITVRALAKMAQKGRGPRFHRLGKQVYYKRDDLVSWVQATLVEVTQGRTPARGARGDSPVIAEADSGAA